MRVILFRYSKSDQGTFGVISFNGHQLRTGELPWKDNSPNTSCIPVGKYSVRVRFSPKFGRVYEVTGVPKRSHILFHQGNFCGSKESGFRSNVSGCILLGTRKGKINGQAAVLNSRIARRRFESVMEFEPFNLEVRSI